MVLFAIVIALGLPGIPFDWWGTFKLEERFGFNKSTQQLWVMDKIKGLLIGFVIGYPMLALLIYLVQSAGALWWLWGFAVFFIVSAGDGSGLSDVYYAIVQQNGAD